jgi:hypothetical protein
MSKKIICTDSLEWLKKQPDNTIPNFLTGICDMGETQMNLTKYLKFFNDVSTLMFKKLSKEGYCIFIQTDRKYNKTWIDKSNILTTIALNLGLKVIFHKIVLLREQDRTDLHRPTYAHMLCYAYPSMTTGAATPDVIPVSKRLYKNGTPILAAKRGLEFIKRYSKKNNTIVDPFVGRGTITVLANNIGLNAFGIDIDPEQVKIAIAANKI